MTSETQPGGHLTLRFWLTFAITEFFLVAGLALIGRVPWYALALASVFLFIALVTIDRSKWRWILDWRLWQHEAVAPFSGPDMPIQSLFFHIDPDVLEDEDRPHWKTVGDSVLNKLSTGQMHAWGELADGGSRPLTPIPQDFWGTAEFTFNFFGEEKRGAELVHAQTNIRGSRRRGYRNIQFNKSQVSKIWRPPSEAHHVLWLSFAVPISLLFLLAAVDSYADWKHLFRAGVPEGALVVGSVNLQRGPQIADDALLMQIQLNNSWNSPVEFEATRIHLVFNGTELRPKETNVVNGRLLQDESIQYRVSTVPKILLDQEIYDFDLHYQILYGLPGEPKVWKFEKRMNCRAVANDFSRNSCKFLTNNSGPVTP